MAKGFTHLYCQVCHGPSRYAVCDTCFDERVQCPTCPRLMRKYYRGTAKVRKTCRECLRRPHLESRAGHAQCRVCKGRYARKKGSKDTCMVCPVCLSRRGTCPACGRDMPYYSTKGDVRSFCSEACKLRTNCHTPEMFAKAALAHYGNGPRKTPAAQLVRASAAYSRWRRAVLKRDNRTCQRCGGITDLEVHHVHAFKDDEAKRMAVSNGITLCIKCHAAVDPARRTTASRLNGRWSLKHDCCIECGRTDRKHASRGLCCACLRMRVYYAKRGTPDQSSSMASPSITPSVPGTPAASAGGT